MLPAKGRPGRPPAWPFATSSERELEVWKSLWATPQAVAWARLAWSHDVALYVRHLVQAEFGDLKAAGEARQWSDRLGLNPAAMLRNRWKVSEDDLGARRAKSPQGGTARDRLKAISGGAG